MTERTNFDQDSLPYWREHAPAYAEALEREETTNVKVYDAGEQYGDRYSAVFPDGEILGIGESGNTPNGFCQHVGNVNEDRGGWPSNETLVPFDTLPDPVQRAIQAEWQGWYV